MPAFVLRADADLKVTYTNHLRSGLTIDEVIGVPIMTFIPDSHQDVAKSAFDAALRGEQGKFRTLSITNGEKRLYDAYVAPLSQPDGTPGVCMVAEDITDDHQRHAALRVSDDKLRVVLEATGIGLWSWDAEQGVMWDRRMHEITGHDTPLATDAWTDELVHPEDRELIARAMERVHDGVFEGAPHRIIKPDGEVRWILPAGRIVMDDAGVPTNMYGGVLDVTKQQLLEEQMRHTQKLEAVGRLTAGVAHNFNNLLMAILPTLDLLEPVVPTTHLQHLEDATHAAERGAELVRELMTFAGQRGRVSRVIEEPTRIIEQAIKICRRTFEGHVVLKVDHANNLPSVFCDPGAIEHSLVNLILNARDALGEDGGHVTVRARRATPEERAKAGGHGGLTIEVSDDGAGIDPEIRSEIFEPFVSGKGPHGTGLGLSTVYAVVTDHGGTIEVESTVGEGSTFRLVLPAEDVSHESTRQAPMGKRVLIVDDEDAVRRVVRRLLERSNFVVTEASSVEEASKALDQIAPDVILLDRSLPFVSGRTFVPLARTRCPSARILYFTGQHIPPDERREVDGVVQKPIRMKGLIDAVESAIRARR